MPRLWNDNKVWVVKQAGNYTNYIFELLKNILLVMIYNNGIQFFNKTNFFYSKKRRLLHILERHLRKPVYKCKYCLFSSTHDRSAVEAHQKEKHASKAMNTISNLFRHKGELKRLALECFNEPNLKLSE